MLNYVVIIFCMSSLYSENIRYLDEVFETVVKTEDIVYGNAPDLPFWFWVESNTVDIDLTMDIYEPAGDSLLNRPVIIFAHTGAFFSGNNELDDVVDLSISAAKRGYVAVSMNYRLGLNVLSAYSGERAVYRGVQDGAAAIRYLREYSSQYRINPEKVFMWGTSAGAFLSLHLGYLEDENRPEATYGIGNDPDLGCLVCEGNQYEQNPKPNAIVSCWGAIGDLEWIDQDDSVPIIMFHGTSDPIVPFESGYPFTIDIALPIVYGSSLIHERLNEVGIFNELYSEPGELHEYWGTVNGNWFSGPNEYFYQIQNNAYIFLYNIINGSSLEVGNDCILSDGTEGFLDCELCCWDLGLKDWLGDGFCDNVGGCAWEGPQFDCIELGYDCGDCNLLDENIPIDICEENMCNPLYDTNEDSALDILDIIMVVNTILGFGELECSIDYDNSGAISITDIITMINIILKEND